MASCWVAFQGSNQHESSSSAAVWLVANAARVAAGLGANVVIMDVDLDRMRHLSEVMPPNANTKFSDPHAIQEHLVSANLVISAV